MTLANYRFVPMYFDLGARGPAYDGDAKAVVVSLDSRLDGDSVPTPDVFAVTSSGELLSKVSNYASEVEVLAMMRSVVAKDPLLTAETKTESSWKAARRGWLRYCIGDVKGARSAIENPSDPSQALMLSRIERWEGNIGAARKALKAGKRITAADLAAELGRIEWLAGNFEAAMAAFEAVPHDHPARSESDYHRGLALFHLKHVVAAKAVWLAGVKRFGEDRWSYRADWALAGVNDKVKGGRRSFGMGGVNKSALGRHGYMGRRNPDLQPQKPISPKSKTTSHQVPNFHNPVRMKAGWE